MTTIYEKNGYKDRADYIRNLAWDNGVDEDIAFAIADVYGENEDFDGLVTELEDMGMMGLGAPLDKQEK